MILLPDSKARLPRTVNRGKCRSTARISLSTMAARELIL